MRLSGWSALRAAACPQPEIRSAEMNCERLVLQDDRNTRLVPSQEVFLSTWGNTSSGLDSERNICLFGSFLHQLISNWVSLLSGAEAEAETSKINCVVHPPLEGNWEYVIQLGGQIIIKEAWTGDTSEGGDRSVLRQGFSTLSLTLTSPDFLLCSPVIITVTTGGTVAPDKQTDAVRKSLVASSHFTLLSRDPLRCAASLTSAATCQSKQKS